MELVAHKHTMQSTVHRAFVEVRLILSERAHFFQIHVYYAHVHDNLWLSIRVQFLYWCCGKVFTLQ